jgi:hypothetical protein
VIESLGIVESRGKVPPIKALLQLYRLVTLLVIAWLVRAHHDRLRVQGDWPVTVACSSFAAQRPKAWTSSRTAERTLGLSSSVSTSARADCSSDSPEGHRHEAD